MTGSAQDSETQRIFIALDLPMPIEQGMAAWGLQALTDPGLRPARPEAIHLTLCFLGASDQARVDGVIRVVKTLPAEPVQLRLKPDPVARPKRKPRVIAIEAESEAACALQARLLRALVAGGLAESDERPFWPHVTIARVRSRAGEPRRVLDAPTSLPAALTDPFDAVRISVYRSNLRPRGAEYVPLARKDLPPTA